MADIDNSEEDIGARHNGQLIHDAVLAVYDVGEHLVEGHIELVVALARAVHVAGAHRFLHKEIVVEYVVGHEELLVGQVLLLDFAGRGQ